MPIIGIVAAGGLQPSAPIIGTATGGDGSASVAFTASSYIGKGTISYTATSSPGGFTGTGSSSPITVSGLSNGTAYTFTVVGTTNYGVASVASSASNSVTPAPGTGYFSIASTTLGSSAPSITFSSIPNTYKHLVIRGVARSTKSGVSDPMLMTFNGSSSGYNNQGFISNATGIGFAAYNDSPAYMYLQRCAGTSTTDSNYFGSTVFTIMDYTANKHKSCFGEMGGSLAGGSSSNWAVGPYAGNWNDTSAISSITITPLSGNFVTNTRFSLYGIL